jgi:hypothetical protein
VVPYGWRATRDGEAKISPVGICLDDLVRAWLDAPRFAAHDFANGLHANM